MNQDDDTGPLPAGSGGEFPSTIRVEAGAGCEPTIGTDPGSQPGAPPPQAAEVWVEFPEAVQNRYAPVGILGEGGMGIVFEAHDLVLDRPVAIKGPRGSREATVLLDLFAREVRTSARLAHPNILPVFDTWIDRQGRPWCSMLRVPGSAPSLAGMLDGLEGVGPEARDLGRLFDIFRQICRGVAHAHEKGLVHRDLKPENVLLGRHDEAFVADWGIADVARESSDVIVGTLFYAPPEQLGKRGPIRADMRADVHALGVILLEMLIGRKPAREILGDTAGPTRPLEGSFPARVPRELAAIVLRAVAVDPADRFADVMSLVQAIDSYENGGLVEGLAYSRAEKITKWFGKNPATGAGLVVGFLGLLFFVGSLIVGRLAVQEQADEHAWVAAHAYQVRAQEARTRGSQEVADAYSAWALDALPRDRMLSGGTAAAMAIRPHARDPLMWTVRLESNVEHVRFVKSSAGLTMLAGTSQGWLWRWAWPSGKLLRKDRFHEGFPWGVTVSLSGDWIASGSKEGLVRIRAITSAGLGMPRVIESHLQPLWSLDFGTEGEWLITGGFDRKLVRWNAATGAREDLGDARDQIWAVAAGSGKRRAALSDMNNRVRVHPVDVSPTTTGIDLPRPGGATGENVTLYLKMSSDDRWLASAASDGSAELWDLEDPAQSMTRLPLDEDKGGVFAFSPGNELLAVGDHRGKVHIFDRNRPGKALTVLASSSTGMQTGLDFSPDGHYLAAGGQDKILSVYDLRRVTLESPPRTVGLGLMPRGRVVVGRAGGLVEIHTLDTIEKGSVARSPEVTMTMGGDPLMIALPPDGSWLAASTYEKELALWTTSPVSETCRRDLETGLNCLAASSDGSHLAGGGMEGGVVVWEAPSGREIARLETGTLPVQDLVYVPGNSTLIYSTSGGEIRLGNPLSILPFEFLRRPDGRPAHEDLINTLAVDPQGRYLASAGIDLVVRLWDLERRTLVRELEPAHRSHVYSCAFDHTGKRLLSNDMGNQLFVWDVETGERILTLRTLSAQMNGTVFDDRGRILAAGGSILEMLDLPRLGRLDQWIKPLVDRSMFVPGEDPTELVPRAGELALPPD